MTQLIIILNHLKNNSINKQIIDIVNHANNKLFFFHIFYLEKKDSELIEKFNLPQCKIHRAASNNFFTNIFSIIRFCDNSSSQIICVNNLKSEFIALLIKTWLKIKQSKKIILISTRHNGLFNICSLKNIFKNGFYIIACQLSDLNIVVNDHLKKLLNKQLRVNDKKIKLIYNGVKINQPLKLSNNIQSKKTINILYTGQLIKRKNLDFTIKALNLIKQNFHFFIVGDGHETNSLKKLAKKYKLDTKFTFTGQKNNCSKYLKKSDIFILPSYSEGLSYSLLEAMNSGLACIVSDIPANNLIKDGINGLTFSLNKKPSDLAKLIKQLIENKNLRLRLGKKARTTIQYNYSKKKMLSAYYQLFTSLTKSCQSIKKTDSA